MLNKSTTILTTLSSTIITTKHIHHHHHHNQTTDELPNREINVAIVTVGLILTVCFVLMAIFCLYWTDQFNRTTTKMKTLKPFTLKTFDDYNQPYDYHRSKQQQQCLEMPISNEKYDDNMIVIE
ncbi:uncharacterized protein LOC113795644 [Dermatophagoides pteronyssinus]|uniref:uncharacterized protein LOC113795644 n=1 Tax=Dermatophagoides pteronyssinus TaxID=6956 RepID=UPI003F66F8C3